MKVEGTSPTSAFWWMCRRLRTVSFASESASWYSSMAPSLLNLRATCPPRLESPPGKERVEEREPSYEFGNIMRSVFCI